MSTTIVQTYPDYQCYENDSEIPTSILINNYEACERILASPKQFPKANFTKVEALATDLLIECNLRGLYL